MQKYLTARNIFIVFGVIIALEVIWAGWSLLKPTIPSSVPADVTKTSPQKVSITLSSAKAEYKLGEQFEVDINIYSPKYVDGADLIITYDPKMLTAQPATPGTIFSDYPQNTVDASLGRISISGITKQTGGVVPNGEFGKLTFVAKAAGTTKIAFDFTPGQTVETNVVESATDKDILESVNQLELTILP